MKLKTIYEDNQPQESIARIINRLYTFGYDMASQIDTVKTDHYVQSVFKSTTPEHLKLAQTIANQIKDSFVTKIQERIQEAISSRSMGPLKSINDPNFFSKLAQSVAQNFELPFNDSIEYIVTLNEGFWEWVKSIGNLLKGLFIRTAEALYDTASVLISGMIEGTFRGVKELAGEELFYKGAIPFSLLGYIGGLLIGVGLGFTTPILGVLSAILGPLAPIVMCCLVGSMQGTLVGSCNALREIIKTVTLQKNYDWA